MQRMTISELKNYMANNKEKPKSSKWKNVKKEYNGRVYHSTKEADYAKNLDIAKKGKGIVSIEPQVPFKLMVNGVLICKYILDFRVIYKDGRIEHIDVKGAKHGLPYEMFKLKKKLMKACHGIDVIEV